MYCMTSTCTFILLKIWFINSKHQIPYSLRGSILHCLKMHKCICMRTCRSCKLYIPDRSSNDQHDFNSHAIIHYPFLLRKLPSSLRRRRTDKKKQHPNFHISIYCGEKPETCPQIISATWSSYTKALFSLSLRHSRLCILQTLDSVFKTSRWKKIVPYKLVY